MGYDARRGISGGVAGGLSGAAIGGPPGALIGGIAGLMGGFGGGAEAPQYGYDIVEMPQYSYSEPMLRQTSDYLTDTMSRLGEGKFPAYYDKALPQIRAGMADPLKRTFFGTAGNRGGLVQQAMSRGAQAGVGPKGAMAYSGKAVQDYANQEAQIDAFLASMGVDIMNKQSMAVPSMAMSMPRGPETQIVNYMGGVGGGNQSQPMDWGNFPWGMVDDFRGEMGNLFGGGGGVQGGVHATQKQFSSFGGGHAGATPAGYTGTIQPF